MYEFCSKKKIHILKCFLRWPVRTKHGQKTYNANLKQIHIIRNTNTQLYNTNITFKWNQKIRNTIAKLYNTTQTCGFCDSVSSLCLCCRVL